MRRELDDVLVEVHVGPGVVLPWGAEVAERAVRSVLDTEGVRKGEVSVAFVADAEIALLNEQYLGHEGPTDVLCFPLHPPGAPLLGDVYVGVAQAERQAEELGVPLAEELLRLAIHGTLHVLGYDHPAGEDRYNSPMYHRQEELLKKLEVKSGK